MKTLTAGMLSHIAGETTTLATCWKVTRTDAVVYGFTNHTQDIYLSGVSYVAATGISPTAVVTTQSLEVDNLNVLGVLDGSIVTDDDLRARKWDFATVEIFQVNYADLTQGTLKLRKGTLGQVRFGRQQFEAELNGLTQRLTQSIGRIFGPACDADLGDARCGINLGTFSGGTITGTLTSVTSRDLFTDSGIAQAAGWFSGGKITFTGGANNGLSMEVKTHSTGGVLQLHELMPYTVAVGDTYSMTAGCDKTRATCISKFNNIVNFQGYPDQPGMDRLASGT